MPLVIGVDIGGTKIAVILSNETHQTLAEVTAPTPDAAKPTSLTTSSNRERVEAEGRRALLYEVIRLCRVVQQGQSAPITAIGVGTAGQIDPVTGTVLDANENLVGWAGTPIAATLEQEFGVPVAVDNDVRTMALAECQLGAGQGYKHVLCLTVGTGIGGAIVLDGRLWYGAHASAGEFGYLYASPTHTIEQLASGPALEAQYQQATSSTERTPLRIIAQRATTGDIVARGIIQTGAERLGEVLAPILAFIDPQAVVIGGGLIEMDELWWQPLARTIARAPVRSVRETPLLKASLGQKAGVIGAVLLALQKARLT